MESEYDSAQTTLCDEEKFKDYSDIDSETPSPTHNLRRSRLFRPAAILLTIILVLIPLIYFTVAHREAAASHPKFDQCGTTAEEARSRGCVFETTGFTWLPKECHDPTTEEEFLDYISANDLNLYRDTNYTEVVSIEEVRLGEGPGFYVRQQYHTTHCLFLIKKLHRALAENKIVDGQIKPTHHTEHCVGQLLKPHGYRENDIQLSYTKFPYCGKPGGYNVAWGNNGRPAGWTDY